MQPGIAPLLAGKKPIFCKVCKEQCYRLQVQHAHTKGIKKELRDKARRSDPKHKFGAKIGRVERRYEQPKYVHCPTCGEPRDMKGNPLPPPKN